ncbi:MAG TPA: LacI family DNA-binding transcriptional regulator [Actinomycetaceae bacterium]|nr:LacI family DNA-binding transcriptional regulator [Actinomycetaceae bacterium]
MRRRVTLREVAAAAGVSTKTVSRVISGGATVAPATMEIVLQAIKELDYHPDEAARSLRSGKDNSVGLVVDSLLDPFFAELAGIIEARLFEWGLLTIVASTGQSAERERQLLRTMVSRKVSALAIVPSPNGEYGWLHGFDIPLFFLDRIAEVPGARSIVVDEISNARAATRHLIGGGHTRIAFISDRPDLYTLRLREEGFRLAMAAAGIEIDERLVRLDCGGRSGAELVTTDLVRSAEPPTAIFSSNTVTSLGMVAALHATNTTHIAHLSYGDFTLARDLLPAVTVVDHEGRQIGAAAAGQIVAALGLTQAATPPACDPAAALGLDHSWVSTADLAVATPISVAPSTVDGDVIFVPARLIARGSGEQPPNTHRPSAREEEDSRV